MPKGENANASTVENHEAMDMMQQCVSECDAPSGEKSDMRRMMDNM